MLKEYEIENLKENNHYWKVEKAALEVEIKPEQGLEFIDIYMKLPLSDVFSQEKAAKQAGISLGNALEFKQAYFLLGTKEWKE